MICSFIRDITIFAAGKKQSRVDCFGYQLLAKSRQSLARLSLRCTGA
jgi:hypothetical protein